MEPVELLRLAELEDGNGLSLPDLEGMDIEGSPPVDEEEDELDGDGKLLDDELLDDEGMPDEGNDELELEEDVLDELLDDEGMLTEGNEDELELEEGMPGMDWLDDC